MPQCLTKYFSTMEYSEDGVISVPDGLPGFDDEHEFVLIDQEAKRPLVFVQSLATPSLCFIALPARSVEPEYKLAVAPPDLALLELDSAQPEIGRDVLCLAFVAITPEGEISANLLSPLVINYQKRVAVQAIQTNSNYSHRHPVLAGEAEPVCS